MPDRSGLVGLSVSYSHAHYKTPRHSCKWPLEYAKSPQNHGSKSDLSAMADFTGKSHSGSRQARLAGVNSQPFFPQNSGKNREFFRQVGWLSGSSFRLKSSGLKLTGGLEGGELIDPFAVWVSHEGFHSVGLQGFELFLMSAEHTPPGAWHRYGHVWRR